MSWPLKRTNADFFRHKLCSSPRHRHEAQSPASESFRDSLLLTTVDQDPDIKADTDLLARNAVSRLDSNPIIIAKIDLHAFI